MTTSPPPSPPPPSPLPPPVAFPLGPFRVDRDGRVYSLFDGPKKRRTPPRPTPAVEWVAATPGQQAMSVFFGTLSTVILALLLSLVFVSPAQHYASQDALYQELRLTLAQGATPLGAVATDGSLVEPGTPVALLSAPQIGLPREVIVEGTAGAQTMAGIGHRRDTALPCQEGASVLMARASSYGGTGLLLRALQPGQRLDITMGQMSCTYEVMGQRLAGDAAPPAPGEGEGRLTLTTAGGLPYMPTEVVRIDAELLDTPADRPAARLPAGALPTSEAAMGTDESVLFGLVLLLELLVAAAIGLTWMWRRWGRWQTWIVGVPLLATIGALTGSALNQWLLPNLL